MQDDVICRWRYDDIILDVMPTDEKILGFSNRWYPAAIQSASEYVLSDVITIRLIAAPYFLATKLEVFRQRGQNDFLQVMILKILYL